MMSKIVLVQSKIYCVKPRSTTWQRVAIGVKFTHHAQFLALEVAVQCIEIETVMVNLKPVKGNDRLFM